MNFNSREEVTNYINKLTFLSCGSMGSCYLRKKDNYVLKIFRSFEEDDDFDDFTENNIMQFSNIKNNTYIWPTDIIKCNNIIIGYIMPYVNALDLNEVNPLYINLNKLNNRILDVKKDIKIISENGVSTYDVMYNILYNNKFYIIDKDEYSFTDKNPSILEKHNNHVFDQGIYYFLIDSVFESIVNDNKILKDIYKDKDVDILIFLKLLRQNLSELCGYEIKRLYDASNYMDKSFDNFDTCNRYQRSINL